MKVLVTGAGGGLGGELPTVFSDDDLMLLDRKQLDVTDRDKTIETIRSHQPDAIIHAAAYTDVDGAETNLEDARAVNTSGTANVVAAASEASAVLIYPSTDYVFDGQKPEPYTEDDMTNPLSVYGKTKLAGEAEALTYGNSYIIRTSWLYSHNGKSFVTTMLKLFQEKKELKVVSNETSSPTYARDFANGLKDLLEIRPETGTYHLSGGGEANWFEYAQEIAKQAESDIKLEPTSAAEWNAPAKRPTYSKLESGRLAKMGISLPHWKDSLKNFFSDI